MNPYESLEVNIIGNNIEIETIMYGIKIRTQLKTYEFIVLFVILNINSGKKDKKFPYSPDHVLPIKLLIPSNKLILKLSSNAVCKL